MGVVVSMRARQTEILNHPSGGRFLPHCGWNSAVDSIANGVPMIAWPLYADKGMTAALLAEDIGVAIRSKLLPWKEVIGREEIETIIINTIEDKGDARRGRVRAPKLSAEKAVSKGGSSSNSFCSGGELLYDLLQIPESRGSRPSKPIEIL